MAGRGTGTVTVKFLGDISNLKRATGEADSALGKVGKSVGGMAKGAAMVGIPALVGFGAAAVKAFSESEQVAAQTGAVIKSTGGVAKVTAAGVDKLAGSLSAMSGVDDELIASGENVLLTFTKVRNEAGKGNNIFDQATTSALDLSVALGTDLKSANMLVGKALNDPIKGMTALSRSGIQFTDAQKEQVKALVASGDQLGAQKIILAELETQFGGSAKAAGETFAGQLDKLKVGAGNLMEEVGARLVPALLDLGTWLGENIPKAIDALTPAFNTTVGVVKDVIKWVQDLVDKFRDGKDGIGEAGSKIGEFLGQLKETFRSAFEAIREVVRTAVDFVKGIWRVFGDDLVSFTRESIAAIMEVFRGIGQALSGVFDLIKSVLTGKWGEAWDALKKIVDGVWDAIFGVVRNAVTNTIPTIIAGLGQAISSVVRTAFDGLKDAFRGALNWIIDKWNDFKIPAIRVSALGVTQTLSPEVNFPNIGRFHSGGIVPGRPGSEMLGLLQAGERVIPAGARASGGGGTAASPLVIQLVLDKRIVSEVVYNEFREKQRRSGSLGFT